MPVNRSLLIAAVLAVGAVPVTAQAPATTLPYEAHIWPQHSQSQQRVGTFVLGHRGDARITELMLRSKDSGKTISGLAKYSSGTISEIRGTRIATSTGARDSYNFEARPFSPFGSNRQRPWLAAGVWQMGGIGGYGDCDLIEFDAKGNSDRTLNGTYAMRCEARKDASFFGFLAIPKSPG
jgi:hypothetical protein